MIWCELLQGGKRLLAKPSFPKNVGFHAAMLRCRCAERGNGNKFPAGNKRHAYVSMLSGTDWQLMATTLKTTPSVQTSEQICRTIRE
jgi:hypothetical protein